MLVLQTLTSHQYLWTGINSADLSTSLGSLIVPQHPIPPCAINGVGGSSIQAVGIGSIRLIVAKGLHFTLDHVLFVPTANVRLISISAICSAHRCMATFNESECWLTSTNGNRILTGTLTSHRLYAVSGGCLTAEHAYAATPNATLDTWHKRLGHANYRAVLDLARRGLATGMPPPTSPTFTSCEHCILGKQTRSSVPKVRQGEQATRRLDRKSVV